MLRLYEKEYEQFFLKMLSRWENDHDFSGITSNPHSIYNKISYPSYPSFHGRQFDDKFTIRFLESGALPYLEFILQFTSGRNLKLRHQSNFDKFWLKLNLSSEYKTGNKEFDDKYFISKTKSEDDKKIIKDTGFQKQVLECEPFEFFEIFPSNLYLSYIIEDKELGDSEFNRIENGLKDLMNIKIYFNSFKISK